MESIENARRDWEIIGYRSVDVMGPYLVKIVLRKKSDPEKWFYAKDSVFFVNNLRYSCND